MSEQAEIQTPGGAYVSMVDGRQLFLPDNTPPQQLRAMLTRSGNKAVDDNDTAD